MIFAGAALSSPSKIGLRNVELSGSEVCFPCREHRGWYVREVLNRFVPSRLLKMMIIPREGQKGAIKVGSNVICTNRSNEERYCASPLGGGEFATQEDRN